MQTRTQDDPPAFERIRYRTSPRNKADRAKPRGKRPWREHRKRASFAFAV